MALDSIGSNPFNTVFIDTNLETHLAMIFSDHDTVLDLKNKIAVEHPKCFPDIGTIKIHALKVKRKQYFYHLSDFMPVRSAFDGTKRSWLLSLDASTIAEGSDNRLSQNPDSSNQPTSLHTDNHLGEQNDTVPDSCLMRLAIPSRQPLPQLEKNCDPDQDAQNHDASGPGDSKKATESDNMTNEVHHNSYEEAFEARSPAKKKRQTKMNVVEMDAASEKDDFSINPNKEVSKDITMPASANKLKDASTASLNGSVELLENVDASKASFGIEKRKRKRKSSSTDDEAIASIPSVTDQSKGNSVEAPKIRAADPDRESDGTFADGRNAQSAEFAEISAPVQGRRHTDSLQEVGEENAAHTSSDNMGRPGAPCVETTVDSSNLAAASKVERSKIHKKHVDISAKGSPDVIKPDSLGNDIIPSNVDNTVSGDHDLGSNKTCQRFEEDKTVSDENACEGAYLENTEPLDHSKTELNTAKGPTSLSLPGMGKHLEPVNTGSKKKKSKKHGDITAEGSPNVIKPDSLGNDIVPSHDDSSVPGGHDSGSNMTFQRFEEDRVVSNENAQKGVSLENTEPLDHGKTVLDTAKGATSSKLPEMGKHMDPVNAGSKKRKSKKTLDSAARDKAASGTEHAGVSSRFTSRIEPHKYVSIEDSSKEAKKEQSILSEKKRVSKTKTTHASPLGSDTEAYKEIGNEEEYWAHKKVRKTGNVKNVDEKMQKKAKKQQGSTAKNISDLPTAKQTSNPKYPATLKDEQREVNVLSKTKKKKSVKTVTSNQMTGSKLEADQNAVEGEPLHPQRSSGLVMSAKTESKSHEGDNGKGGEDKIEVHTLDIVHTKEVNNEVGTSNNENDRINSIDYSKPSEYRHGVTASAEVPADKAVKGSDGNLKQKKGKKANALVTETSVDAGNSLKPKKIQSEVRSDNASIGVFQPPQKSLQEKENNETISHLKRSLQGTHNELKVPVSQHRSESKPRAEVKRANLVDTLRSSSSARLHIPCGSSGAHSDALSSSSESSEQRFPPKKRGKIHQIPEDHYHVHHHVKVQKAPSKSMGVVNSQSNKSLIAASGSIFKDGSSDSSEDEKESKNSDASARTQSPSSSDSQGESIQSGSHAFKTGIHGNIIDIQSSSPKSITLDAILRSSSRYKKAKLTASQSQLEDSESQPVDFVPDSQANL